MLGGRAVHRDLCVPRGKVRFGRIVGRREAERREMFDRLRASDVYLNVPAPSAVRAFTSM